MIKVLKRSRWPSIVLEKPTINQTEEQQTNRRQLLGKSAKT